MAQTALRGNPIQTNGDLPAVGASAPAVELVAADLSPISSGDMTGQNVVYNIFPSVDTPTCAQSIRTFNERAASLDNTKVVCVSADLPFAGGRFCGAEGIDNVVTGSTFRNPETLDALGVRMVDGPLAGLAARAVVVVDAEGNVAYSQLVPEIADEPDYDAALAVI